MFKNGIITHRQNQPSVGVWTGCIRDNGLSYSSSNGHYKYRAICGSVFCFSGGVMSIAYIVVILCSDARLPGELIWSLSRWAGSREIRYALSFRVTLSTRLVICALLFDIISQISRFRDQILISIIVALFCTLFAIFSRGFAVFSLSK